MQKIKTILLSKKNLKRDIGITLMVFLAAVSIVKAGNLDSPGSPGATGYTLTDIYQRLTTNQSADEGDHDFSPSADPAASFHTLKEIYEAIPTIEAGKVKSGTSYLGISGTLIPNGGTAEPGQVLAGETFFGGNQSNWTLQTGTMPNIGQQNITPGTSDQLTTLGYHDGTGKVLGDADLVSGNIKSGISIFGVNGNSNVVDTASGDAIAGEIVSGKKAWVDGLEITGTLANIGQQILTPGTANQAITSGYHNGTGYVLGDADLVSANIRSGVNLFGIDGNSNVVNTSSGNAIAADLLSGKIAWVGGLQIIGTADIYTYGDNSAAKVLTTASAAGTYNAENLSASTVKKATVFGVGSTGTFSGYPGTGWIPNGSGDGSTALNQTNCENAANWKWFEDGNGDGDTTDPEDGECVRTLTPPPTSDSWNGAEQMNGYSLADTTMATGTSNSVTVSGTPWTADRYKNEIVKIISGTGSGCWGIVKTNTTSTITVFGSWLQSSYAACASTPDGTSHIQVFDDNKYDNSFIGDYSCTGNFPDGTATLGSYPSSGIIALAVTDCYDGKRDLLPSEQDRAVLSGTATAADATSITDSSQVMTGNAWMGQKVLITGGTGNGTSGIVESNTATALTVGGWSGTAPAAGSTFKVIYILPRASYVGGTGMSQIIGGSSDDSKANEGPLTQEILKEWRGTKLPTANDFFGFCGYKDGGSNYENTTGANSGNKKYGNLGSQVGRIDEFMDLANSGFWEWLSEQHYFFYARVAGTNACSYFGSSNVYNSYRFRSVFRP